jgi:hypothetical protein
VFALERVRVLAPQHPEWRTTQPFQAILEGDQRALGRMTEHDFAAVIAATHADMTTTEFTQIVQRWLSDARHPRFQQPCTWCTYKPMVELLGFLRRNGFKTYIVSGGGADFIRAFSEITYGIPPEQVIGSTGKTRFEVGNRGADLVKLPEVTSIDDGPGKPVNIGERIGRRPILAFGNADGDLEMLQYVVGGRGPHLAALVHHDDEDREYAYDREGKRWGRLDKALDAAHAGGWTVVSMRSDWNVIFPTDNP